MGVTYGTETYNSKINQVMLTQIQDNIVPYYALDFEGEYSAMSEMDRVIFMIRNIREYYSIALMSLSAKQRKNILLLGFDEIVVDTEQSVNRICSFLDTETTPYTAEVLRREKCPRVLDRVNRQNKLGKIQEIASEQGLKILLEMIKDYEKDGI